MHTVEELNPQLVLNVRDRELGLLGYVVLDRTIDGRAAGGIRMTSDLTIEEVANLAREMTHKFAFLGIHCGGAKAGIIIPPSFSAEKKRQILLGFGKSLSPLIISGIYGTGTDMGTSPEDLYYILRGAGRKVSLKAFQNTESGYYSALTVFITAEKLIYHLGLNLSNCSVAIEGFGKLGMHIAKLFSDTHAKVVAISTIRGAIYNPEGLNIYELITLRDKFGDEAVTNYQDAEMIRKEELLTLNVDILVPCAGADTLNLNIVEYINAKIIVPGANIAADERTEDLLWKKGIYYVPGFISNCGEVLKHFLWAYGLNEKEIQKMIKKRFGRKISNLIEFSHRRAIHLGQMAREISIENLHKIEQGKNHFKDMGPLLKGLKKLSTLNFLPYKVILILRWFIKSLTISHVNKILS